MYEYTTNITSTEKKTTTRNKTSFQRPAWLWTLKLHFYLVNRWIIHQMDVNHKTETPIFSGDLGPIFSKQIEIQDCDGFWDLYICIDL